MALSEVLGNIGRDPKTVGAFFDFDGTLSEIVDDPAAVTPLTGVVDAMTALAATLGVVGVVSGRPVSFLDQFFPDARVQLSGLYGLEHRADGTVSVNADAEAFLPTVLDVADRARAEFGFDPVEDKGYSLTVHYRRGGDELADRVHAWTDAIASETGLEAHPAKMSVELHPPIPRSKGDAVEEMATGLTAACYFGDDLGDLPAFRRLIELEESDTLAAVATVLVVGSETPDELRASATDLVEGPGAALATIQEMVTALPTQT